MEPKSTDISLVVGKIDWLAESKAFEEAKTALMETIKQDALLRNDWSILGKEACKKLFDLVSTKPGGTTFQEVATDLQAIAKEISASLKEKGSPKFTDLAGAIDPRNQDNREFYMLLSKDKDTQEANQEAIRAGKAKDTLVQMGSMNIKLNGDALQISDFNRGLRLAEESAAGRWSKTTQESWRRVFNDMTERVGADPQLMRAALRKYTTQIDEYLRLKKPGNSVGLETKLNEKAGELEFILQLNIQQGNNISNRGNNAESLRTGKDTETSIKAGSIRLKDRPVTKPKNAA